MTEKENNKSGKGLVKMVFLLVFIVVAVYLVRFSPVKQYLSTDQLGLLLEAAGLWAPLMFVIIYVVGVCLFFLALYLPLWVPQYSVPTGGSSTSGQGL